MQGNRTTRLISLAAAATLTAGLAPAALAGAVDAGDDFHHGAPGVGDEYYPRYGNGGYDVEHYKLKVRYNPGTDELRGLATIKAVATENLDRFNLDFVGMDIQQLKVNGRSADWRRTKHELIVTPKQPLPAGTPITTKVRYRGIPTEFVIAGTTLPAGFMTTRDGATVAGQPEVATAWFPVNDHPLDKASYTFNVTVPNNVEVVANGFLRSTEQRGRWTTYVWHAAEPMASYLATFDVGHWDTNEWTTESGIPVYDAVDSAIRGPLRRSIDASLARQGEVLDVLSDSFGPYPFSTVGAIVDNQDDLFFALETQTRPVYSKYFWPIGGDSVIAHELAHQWYGDHVALAQWKDIWLNEGPASYAEWLWAEHDSGVSPQEIFEAIYEAIPADDPFWDVPIASPGIDDLFSDPVYTRGAMTLQALRLTVGDDDFFTIMQDWSQRVGPPNGSTEEFMALAEEVSGQQLDDLFDAWLFGTSKPPLPAAAQPTARTLSAPAQRFAQHWRENVAKRLQLSHGHGY